jgi:hypothetical protein
MNEIFGILNGEQNCGFVDDLDGTPAIHTVRIGWGNEWREIPLSEKNFVALAEELDRFWGAARPVVVDVVRGTTRTRRPHQ